ncbi:cyanate transporter [Photobacterium sp. WH77]|uniref:cyanate transporter n=1 Tax=unclassified Photobacterium TaxID=2628852 RepID=UPI001EDB8E72|nr:MULTISPECIES: cyanate transporter [unclassified Photobacterium]MCG2838360.1 cyanate transporter [Photobacterium sp. WH77]MCG2845925.1 cyanate transporter [Photobacterium sp. WH80]
MIPAAKYAQHRSGWMILVLIVFIGLNLRPFLVAPGPILNTIMPELGMTVYSASLLTLLPMLLMGVGAFVSPGLQAAWGIRKGMLIALAVLFLGSVLRIWVQDGLMFIFTAVLCGAGVAFVQSAMPGLIKSSFPRQVAPITGVYSACLMVGGALGAYSIPHLMDAGLSWRQSLGLLAVPVFIALLAGWRYLTGVQTNRPAMSQVRTLLHRPRTWSLMAAFGLVNGGYSTLVAWLAPYYQSLGWERSDSATLIVVMSVCQAISAVGLPVLARKQTDRRWWLMLTLVMQSVGFCGLALWPAGMAMLWVGMCGAGLGGSFALIIVTALDHSKAPEAAGTLAALMQGGGFILAGLAPWVIALLNDMTGSFVSGWLLHLGLVVITACLYWRFNPRDYDQVMQPVALSHR